ncbi:unnamed protein product, partial [Callosobruchus maculatus]
MTEGGRCTVSTVEMITPSSRTVRRGSPVRAFRSTIQSASRVRCSSQRSCGRHQH